MADAVAHEQDDKSVLGVLYSLFDQYQKGVEEFYKFFEEDQSPQTTTHETTAGKRPQNVKLNSKFIPDSYTAEIENYWEFLIALPWKEGWMIGLMLFHVCCFLSILMTRKSANFQYAIFFLLLTGVYFSERLNELAADHHKRFSSENFFDSNGLFISTVFSVPILFNCICLITIWLSSATRTLFDLKNKQQIASQKKTGDAAGSESKKEK